MILRVGLKTLRHYPCLYTSYFPVILLVKSGGVGLTMPHERTRPVAMNCVHDVHMLLCSTVRIDHNARIHALSFRMQGLYWHKQTLHW